MWLQIVARRIIMPFVFSVILYFWGPLSDVVRQFNLVSSGGSFVILATLCSIQLFLILAVWELLIFHFFVKLQWQIDEVGRNAVRKRNVGLAVFSIRLKHALLWIQRILRQGWISVGDNRANVVWRSLNLWSARRVLGGFVKLVFSAPVCFSIACACLMLRSTNSSVEHLYEKFLYFMGGSLRVGDVFHAVLSRVPVIVALMPLISLPFFLLFYSHKRNVRRAIGRNKAVHVDEVALLYERLLLWFDRNLYRLCSNFEYVVTVQQSLVDFQLKRIIPVSASGSQVHRMLMGVDELDHYMFLELDDLDELSQIVCELLDGRLKRYTRHFSAASGDVWEMYFNDLHILKSINGVESAFFCKGGVKSLVDDRISRERRLIPGEDRRGELCDELAESLSWQIYAGLERLNRIRKASRALRRYLYSSRAETLILKVLSRDK